MMKTIDIQQQPLLGFARTARIALTGVRYRLFRAAVTVAVIAVAMAFLMNILSESLIKKTVAEAARDQIAELHRTDRWIARLSVPQTAEEIIRVVAHSAPGAPALREIAVMCGLSAEHIGKFSEPARQAQRYLDFFAGLNYGRRRVLVGSASATAIFDRLQEPAEQARFFNGLKDMKAVRFVASPDEFRAFLQRWPDLKAFIQQVRAGQQQAVQHVQERLDRRAMLQALEDANGEFGRAIREAGFELADTEALSLVDQARLVSDTKAVEDTINQTVIRQAIAARRDVLPGDVTIDMIWKMLRDRDTAEWYIGTMRAAGVEPGRIDAARLTAMAQARARARLLVKTEMLTVDAGGGFMGVGRRMTWLAFVSMLVCVVGIANAMLMSVTERFREIATLKCLGALDGFIMTVFLIEACVMGLVGGVIGTLIGLVLGVARMWAAFQSLLAQAFPTGLLLGAALISIGLGIMLAAVAAVYPSLRAARLAPMEAMRIE